MSRDGKSEQVSDLKIVERIIDDFSFNNKCQIDINMGKNGMWKCTVQSSYHLCKSIITIKDKTSLEALLSELIFEIKNYKCDRLTINSKTNGKGLLQ